MQNKNYGFFFIIIFFIYTAPIYIINRYLYLYIGTYCGALEPWRYWRRKGS
eukprot:SAG11_NODE_1596_length_4611_cov_3.725842_3_plen_51_part_00